jgi:transposase
MAFYKDLKDQQLLLPLNIRDMIPENHICFLVDEIIQKMDLAEFEKKYEGAGHPAYHPKIILKLLILGMIEGIRSSRKIAKNARENVAYMYLAGLLKPDFRTISDFRKNNLNMVKLSFQETVELARDIGMVSLGHICIDGTKIKANASNHSAIKKDEFSELRELIQKEMEEGIKVDEAEDETYGDKNIDEMPDNITRKTIIERVREKYRLGDKNKKDIIKIQIQKVETEMETTESAISFTDPESRFMPNSDHVKKYSYNPQVAVDSSYGIIISSDVTSEATDRDNLQPQIKQVEENVGQLPEGTKITADNGYYSSKNLKFLLTKGLDGYIPDLDESIRMKGKEVKDGGPFSKEEFMYDPEGDFYICPNDQKLTFRYEYLDINVNRNVRKYWGNSCKQCSDMKSCTKNFREGRVIKDYEGMELERLKMKEKMSTEYGRHIYHVRKKVVERIFGHIKANLGFREFLLRGRNGAKIEFNLACIASNLRRIWNYFGECEGKKGSLMC